MQDSHVTGNGLSLPDRLMKKKIEVENRIKFQKEEKEKNELVGCTFHPNIIGGVGN